MFRPPFSTGGFCSHPILCRPVGGWGRLLFQQERQRIEMKLPVADERDADGNLGSQAVSGELNRILELWFFTRLHAC